MSYDGFPPDLQSLCSKVCLFSLKSSTLCSENVIPLNSQAKTRAPKSLDQRPFIYEANGRFSLTKSVPDKSCSGPDLTSDIVAPFNAGNSVPVLMCSALDVAFWLVIFFLLDTNV